MKLTTETELANVFGITAEKVSELRRRNRWPHVRLGRFDVRYTDEQVAAIVAMSTVKKAKAATAPTTGQTARSARRSS